MAARGDWLEAPAWWRRYKPLRWVLAIVVFAWIYVQAGRWEREPARAPARPVISEKPLPAPSVAKPAAATPSEKAPASPAAAPRAKTAPVPPPPRRKAPEKRKDEIRSLRPV